ILCQALDVDDRHDEPGTEERHLTRAFILSHEVFDRFGIERIERTLCSRLIVEFPEFRRDIPGQKEIAAGDLWTVPGERNLRHCRVWWRAGLGRGQVSGIGETVEAGAGGIDESTVCVPDNSRR